MSVTAATALALWGAAYAAGSPADDVLAGLAGHGVTAGVRGDGTPLSLPLSQSPSTALPGPGDPPAGTSALLPLLRNARPTLLLPRAGDLRGLPGPAGSEPTGRHAARTDPARTDTAGRDEVRNGSPIRRLTDAAQRSGAAVALADLAVTIVPLDGHWRVYADAGAPAPVDQLAARTELDAAVQRAARLFTDADLGVEAADARDLVERQVEQRTLRLPPGAPQRAAALLDRCIRLESLLAVASGHRTAAVNLHGLGIVADALAPLADAARQARIAAVDAMVRALVPVPPVTARRTTGTIDRRR